MVASIVYPDVTTIEVLKPLGEKASEGIYLAMGIELLPVGMVGIMICSIFAATMSSMDSTLNRNAGIFVKNFYAPVIRKNAKDKELFFVGKVSTIVLGILIILSAIAVSKFKMNLFDLTFRLGAMISLPFMIPLTLGLLFKNTPRWAGWTTVVFGMLISFLLQQYVEPDMISNFLDKAAPLNDRERIDIMYILNVFLVMILCSAWFLATRLFRKSSSEVYHQEVDTFFTKFNTPIDYEKEHGNKGNDHHQYLILGNMCLVYGAFLSLLILIPNDWIGRLCYVFIGGIMLSVGFVFKKKHKKMTAKLDKLEST